MNAQTFSRFDDWNAGTYAWDAGNTQAIQDGLRNTTQTKLLIDCGSETVELCTHGNAFGSQYAGICADCGLTSICMQADIEKNSATSLLYNNSLSFRCVKCQSNKIAEPNRDKAISRGKNEGLTAQIRRAMVTDNNARTQLLVVAHHNTGSIGISQITIGGTTNLALNQPIQVGPTRAPLQPLSLFSNAISWRLSFWQSSSFDFVVAISSCPRIVLVSWVMMAGPRSQA
jgi:hypothetical protein